MNTKRYYILDGIRGFALVNMLIYHGVWDLVYMFGCDWQWYRSELAYAWQQYICWTFIFLSGFCFSFAKKKLKRGLIVFLSGLLISIVTLVAMPENRVIFGILTLIGSCMLLMIPLEQILKRIPPAIGMLFSFMLFLLTRNVNQGCLGFGDLRLVALPDCWYQNLLTTYLGFPTPDFYSTDYFSLFPWVFLFATGYFANCFLRQKNLLFHLQPCKIKPLEWLGQHSLGIYIVHQPLIYLVLTVFFLSIR